MRRRDLAGQDQLQAGVERLGDARLAAQRRVLEHQDTPLGLLGADQPAGLEHVRPDLVVAEEHRRDRALRLRRNERAEHLPEGRQAERADALIEGAALGGPGGVDTGVAIHRRILRHRASPLSAPLRRGYNGVVRRGAVP